MISVFVNNDKSANKTVSTKGDTVTINFNPPIDLKKDKQYQLRCLNANIVYCMPNVTTANNKLVYTVNGGAPITMTFDTGLYSLDDINIAVSLFTMLPANGGDKNLIQFFADQATSKVYVFFNATVVINCAASKNIMSMLGFPPSQTVSGVKSGGVKSTNQAQLNALQNILIKCDIVTGSYQNSQLSNIIASVTPDCAPYSTIIYIPIHPLRVQLRKGMESIQQMTLSLVDQNGYEIDMGTDNGSLVPELWSAQIDIEPVDFARIL